MSLERFTNKDDILSIDGVTRGIVWKKEDIELLSLDTKGITPEGVSEVEVHVYSKDGGYINSILPNDFTLRANKLYVNYADALGALGINRGEFELVTNIHEPVLGNFNDRILQVKEISPDRREILAALIPVVPDKVDDYKTVIQDYLTEYSRVYDQDLAINFGKNNVFKVINHKGWDTDNELVIRLYNELPDDILLNDTFWIVEELADSYIDNVNLTVPLPTDEVNYLKGANFDIDEGAAVITETEFKSWNDLLDANLSTSQQILDRVFSGSLAGVPLGIDYSAFDNFVFYSSAYERLANFKYKLELIEYYNDRIATLDVALGSDEGSLTSNITNTQARIDNIIGSFDGFERYLYNEPTGSLTTHGVSGSYLGADGYVITPWPKYLSNGSYVIHDPSTTIASNWFATASANAILYDDLNTNALTKTIPEHIRVDPNNSQYELFVNMIGHHFDILYSYIDALSRNYRNEEHPKLGVGKDTLYDIAKSMGWTLTNGNQATALWKYKLGLDAEGKYQSTGSLFSKSNEEITTEVWRRIVNNLPYLLKTKGTARSIKALMSCYGIPQTLLSIREYGGPAVSGDAPNIIEDRYAYMIALNNDSNPAIENGIEYISYTSPTTISTRELRFRTITGSFNASMQLFTGGGSNTVDIEYYTSGLYSGSDRYGRAVLNGTIETPWAPIFDGDVWNLRWWRTSGGTGYIQLQKASDYFTGRISHQVSASGAVSAFSAASNKIGAGFTGHLQEFREWTQVLDQQTFNDHTLNPTSYAIYGDPTGSYTTLQVHYTLGSDGNAYDHSVNTTISSSHPNRSYTSRDGAAVGAGAPPNPQLGNYLSIDEVYYIQGISLGGNLPRSQKIRLEDNYLVSKLSPTNTGERSSYDYAPIDNNKLGLFYSHADQVNKDIFDQFGDAELDRYIGDPGDEFETQYRDLRYISDQYWKKYTDRNDVNAYLRIFSQFDFSLFSQIKQLVPLRANLAAGVLVEPHALERAKVQITKRPQVENPQWNAEIPQPDALVFGEYSLYSGSIDTTRDIISAESVYHSGSYNGYTETGDTWFANFAGIQNPGPMDYCIIETNPLDEMPSFTASFTDLISANTNADQYFDWYVPNATTPNFNTLDPLLNNYYTKDRVSLLKPGGVQLWTYFSGAGDYTDTLCAVINNPPYDIDVDIDYRVGVLSLYALSGFDISTSTFLIRIGIGVIDSNGRLESIGNSATHITSIATIGPANLSGTLRNIRIPYSAKRVALTIHGTCLSASTGTGCLRLTTSGASSFQAIIKVREVCHSAEMPIIDQPRPSKIFQRVVYHYSGSYKGDSLERQNARHAYSQSLGLYYKREDVTAAYFDDELSQYENSRYIGCRISAPDINLPVTTENATAILGTPVIEVYETNANQLIFTQAPESRGGTGNTEPGNLLVR
jgi:hypothetical protein